MADFVFNRAKGRVAEFAERVVNNDPANSALVIVLLASSGLEADSTLQDKDTLADVLAGSTNEATNTGYSRKILDQASGITVTYDDTNDRVDVDIPDQTWTSVQADGGAIGALLVCYDPNSGSGTDGEIIPLTKHDFTVTPDGSDLTAQIAAAGFFRAS